MKYLGATLLVFVSGVAGFLVAYFHKPQLKSPMPSPFKIGLDGATIDLKSPFMKHIETIQVTPAPQDAMELRSLGQIVVFANPSGDLTGNPISWVELDPSLTKSLGLNLKSSQGLVGEAYGTTSIPSSYVDQVKPGQKLDISRYGVRETEFRGVITSVRLPQDEPGTLLVVFMIQKGGNWYPGANCEIEFPLVKSKPLQISKSALLHEGLQEYIFKWTGDDKIDLRRIIIVGETEKDVYALDGDLAVKDKIVGQGAILLKPILHQLLSKREEVSNHAP